MKVGVFTDIHANLPALKTALAKFEEEGCYKIIHLGDLIGIGPYPKECMEYALNFPKPIDFIMGNHDYWYAYGAPKVSKNITEEEVEHHHWTHQQLGEDYKHIVKSWSFTVNLNLGKNLLFAFQHYALNETQSGFKPILKNPTGPKLANLFSGVNADVVCYGHDHVPCEKQDRNTKRRFINVGSAGCYHKPEAKVLILDIGLTDYTVEKYDLPYDDNGLMTAFESKQVPARKTIMNTFITR